MANNSGRGSTWQEQIAKAVENATKSNNTSTTTTSNANSSSYTYTPVGTYNDANISASDKALIDSYKAAYESAKAAGDTQGMANAHAAAESVREQYMYSGGGDGSEYIPLKKQETGGYTAPELPSATSQESYINDLYDAQREAALAALKSAYDQNILAVDAMAEKIPGIYDETRNQAAANAEINKANLNESFAASGMNTGAGSQVKLSQGNTAQAAMNAINLAQAAALKDVEQQRLSIKTQYQNDIALAIANGDLERASALYKEAVRVDESIVQTALNQAQLNLQAYTTNQSVANADREYQMNLAKLFATAGDYSGLESLGFRVPTVDDTPTGPPKPSYDESLVTDVTKALYTDLYKYYSSNQDRLRHINEEYGNGTGSMTLNDYYWLLDRFGLL